MRLCVVAVFLLFACPGLSQRYNFISYSVEDGLAQNQVFSMLQDDNGYIWFATAGGLSRFDGIDFVNFSQRDGLFRNYVNHLFKDNKGTIWIATVGGVSSYDGKRFTSYSFGPEFQAIQINSVEQDNEGVMWFGTNGGGLIYLENDELNYIDESDGLLSNRVRTLYTDVDGTIWCGTKDGISLIRNRVVEDCDIAELKNISVSNIMGDSDANIWISTFGSGAYYISDSRVTNITEDKGLIDNVLWQAYVSDDNSIWFASRLGLSEYDHERFIETYNEENGLDFSDIRCVMKDSEGNMWFGTNGAGVLKFAGKAFVNYTSEDGLIDHRIMTIHEDGGGNLWLGTLSAGLIRSNSYGYTDYDLEDGLSSLTIWSSLRDSRNIMWFGTSTGLTKLNRDGSFTAYYADDTTASGYLEDDKITALCESDGLIWIGNRQGISSLDPRTEVFRNYNESTGFNGTNIRSIRRDDRGRLWCGAENGVFVFDPDTGESFAIDLGPDTDEPKVFSIVTEGNTVWVGTDNGLYRGNRDEGFEYLSLGQDARANFINFLVSDNGAIWAGTNYGLYKISNSGTDEPVIRSFTTHEGIENPECNMNAVYRDSRGYLWFGTAGGLVRFDKSLLEERDFASSSVSLRSMRLFLEETDWNTFGSLNEHTGLPKDLSLPFNQNHLTFDFILFNYSNPKGVTYRYKLLGFDDDWSPPTVAQLATYSNLPPGDYQFMVMARSSSGTWTNPTSFTFEIRPPFWNTWWFYVICVLAAICIGLGIWVWRQSVHKRKRETEQLVFKNRLLALEHQSLNASMNRHFIFNALNSIQYYINRQDRISANKYLSSFAKLIRKNLDSSSSGNNYVTLAEEIERIELYLSLEHMRFQNKFEYEIIYQKAIDTESVLVPAMLLQPFIENSIWHGVLPMERPGKIQLILDKNEEDDICFEIVDNGIGIDVSLANKQKNNVSHDSKGMKITSGRINLLKAITRKNISLEGPFQVMDNEGNSCGTKVVITIPSNTMETFF